MAEEVKYFKQVKCPDCTWSQYQDSEPCAMTPCDRCKSTGCILVPVDKPKPDISPYEIPHVAYDKYFEPPTDRVRAVREIMERTRAIDETHLYPVEALKAITSLFEPPIWDFSIEDETITTELKGEEMAQEASEYDPQAVEFGRFIEHGWLTPEEARIKDAECQERVKRIKGEIEGRMYNNSPLMIMPMDWQSLWDKELK